MEQFQQLQQLMYDAIKASLETEADVSAPQENAPLVASVAENGHHEQRVLKEAEMRERARLLAEKECGQPFVRRYRFADYEDACRAFADQHGFGEIAKDSLAICLRIPPSGMMVQRRDFIKILYSPVVSEERWITDRAKKRIGGYAEDNGIVVFVYRDGHTYVAKGTGIIAELKRAGYEERPMNVPLSSADEQIMSPYLRETWEKMPVHNGGRSKGRKTTRKSAAIA